VSDKSVSARMEEENMGCAFHSSMRRSANQGIAPLEQAGSNSMHMRTWWAIGASPDGGAGAGAGVSSWDPVRALQLRQIPSLMRNGDRTK